MNCTAHLITHGRPVLEGSEQPKSASSAIREVAQDTLLYSLGPLISSIAGLALVPILTRLFAPAEYGLAETVLAFATTLAGFLVLGVDSAAGRWYFDREDSARRCEVLSTALLFLFALGLLAAMGVALLAVPITRAVFKHGEARALLLIAALGLPAAAIDGYLKHVLRWERARGRYLAVYLTLPLLRLGLSVWLGMTWGLAGVVTAWSASLACSAWLGYWLGRSQYRFLWSLNTLKDLLGYGLSLSVVGLVVPLTLLVDRFLLIHYQGLEEVGLYSAGLKLSMMYVLATEGFRQAWGPIAFSKWADPDFGSFYADLVMYFWIAGALLALGFGFAAPVLVKWLLPGPYAGASSVISVLVLVGVSQDLFSLLGIGVFYHKRTIFFLVAAAVGVVLGVGLELVLIPSLGIRGAALGNAVGRTAAAGLVGVFSQRLLRVPYDWKKVLVGGGITAAIIVGAAL